MKYIYLGDRLTDSLYKNQMCSAVVNGRGKCIRGRNGNMLVVFHMFDAFQPERAHVVVLARLLRKIKPVGND